MARQEINVGATANDGTGDGLRTAYIKCNDNFAELYGSSIEPTFIANGTSNVSVANNANVTISIAGSSNVVTFSGTETNISGNVTIATDLDVGNSLTITQDFTIGDQLIINGSVGSNILPDTNDARTLGNATLRFAETNTVLVDASGNITSGANIAGANIIASEDVIIAGQHVTTGNVTAGNVITSGRIDATGNITGGNIITGGSVTATGDISGAAITGTGNLSVLNITATGSANITAGGFFVGDGGFLSNVTAASNVAVTQIANGTSVVGISSSGGNVEITSGGTLVFQTDGTTIDVVVPMTTANITATGNISGTYILGDGSQLSNVATGDNITSGTSNVTVASNANTTVGVAGSTVLTVASTGAEVTGIVSATGNVSGGNITTAGQVQADNVDATNGITAGTTVSATGNVSGGNVTTAGQVQADNLDATNGITAGTTISATGNVSGGNVTTAGQVQADNLDATNGITAGTTISATGNVSGGNITTGGDVDATGNITTGGDVDATGNITAASFAGSGALLSALNGSNITTGTVAAARVATLNQNTTGTAGGLSSAVTVELTGNITGSATFTNAGDTASIATTLTADPTITLTGDVTGSGTMTNLGNVSFATTIAADSVTLGTDTTGSYVQQGATSGNGISGSVNSEAGTFTVTSNAVSSNTGSTLVFRDASGNFSANVITATATQAQYADLAENYLSDHEYEPGTVISIGGPLEITVCGLGDYPAGVISTDPAYLMNSDLVAGLPVALVGRVPVRVFGSVIKGQLLYSDIMGRASKNSEGHLVGIALEDNPDEGEKLVECMLKL